MKKKSIDKKSEFLRSSKINKNPCLFDSILTQVAKKSLFVDRFIDKVSQTQHSQNELPFEPKSKSVSTFYTRDGETNSRTLSLYFAIHGLMPNAQHFYRNMRRPRSINYTRSTTDFVLFRWRNCNK